MENVCGEGTSTHRLHLQCNELSCMRTFTMALMRNDSRLATYMENGAAQLIKYMNICLTMVRWDGLMRKCIQKLENFKLTRIQADVMRKIN